MLILRNYPAGDSAVSMRSSIRSPAARGSAEASVPFFHGGKCSRDVDHVDGLMLNQQPVQRFASDDTTTTMSWRADSPLIPMYPDVSDHMMMSLAAEDLHFDMLDLEPFDQLLSNITDTSCATKASPSKKTSKSPTPKIKYMTVLEL